MLYLLATILLNSLLFVYFKIFPRFKIDALHAIVANYWTCVATACVLVGEYPTQYISEGPGWLPWALVMGVMFISVFNLLGYTTRVDGITTATVANKLSLVIPAVLSIFLYNEKLGIGKIAGIALAFPAVYLTTAVDEGKKGKFNFWLPALIFIGSGLLDTMVTYVEYHYLHTAADFAAFSIYVFTTAATVGTIAVLLLAIIKKRTIHLRSIIGGILLGVPNYFSIYYLVRLLNTDLFQNSAAIPVTNIGIVLASALVAILFFKEKAPAKRIIGLVLAVISILLIALTDINGGA